eukprot:6193820-Pleurochrysis_carterae.AAC.2
MLDLGAALECILHATEARFAHKESSLSTACSKDSMPTPTRSLNLILLLELLLALLGRAGEPPEPKFCRRARRCASDSNS